LFVAVLQSFWVPNAQKVGGTIERKMLSIAMTNMLTDPAFQNPPYASLWATLLGSNLAVLALPQDESTPEDELEVDDVPGYEIGGGAFTPLSYASKPITDPFAAIPNASQYLAKSLYDLCQRNPGKVSGHYVIII
jgi:hypothetical protein